LFSTIDLVFENRYTYTPHAHAPVTPTSVRHVILVQRCSIMCVSVLNRNANQ